MFHARGQAKDLSEKTVRAQARFVLMDDGQNHEFFNAEGGRNANKRRVHLLGCTDEVTRPLAFFRGHAVGARAQPGERLLGRGDGARVRTEFTEEAAQAHAGVKTLRFGLRVGADRAERHDRSRGRYAGGRDAP